MTKKMDRILSYWDWEKYKRSRRERWVSVYYKDTRVHNNIYTIQNIRLNVSFYYLNRPHNLLLNKQG